ncbi:RNA polymerase-associated protein Ctr9 homolog [Strongyloides ratti]|uniref:RNA polymerase-associated protein Ctr9 homolog n=1 Tax=Strongyloides ratti TaxID=34506 RepID=A0A090KYZ7_STRRB|nr:RNA polymerase-associated protein Ctr9 homolog [Strongyloides ratti]CEF62656.1 RNA polymerase-associated protein Ctr9 homolog [Strongyloides ratti]
MLESNINGENLMIPRRFGGDAIIYNISTLPEVSVIISELMGEHCKVNIWFEFALAYYRLKRYNDFQKILEEGIMFGKEENKGENSDLLKLHDAITSYQILCGCKETEKTKRSQHFSKAMEHLNHGDEIFKYDENHLLQRGFYLLYEGQKLDHAEAQFKFITNTNEGNIPALIGYACVLYNKKEYNKSLQFFKKALKICPKSPTYVRLGIGYCLLKLGYVKKARIAFERVLELEENNSYALTALAVINFSENTLESTTAGAKKLIKSWKNDNNNVLTALELSDFLFLRENYEKSEKYCKVALNLSESPALKSRSHYLVGRCHHQKGQIDLAIKHYNIAISFSKSELINPFFGLGQLYAKKKEFEKAIEYFEKILINIPDNLNLKKALIMMYIRSPGKDSDTQNKRISLVKQYFSELLVGENLIDPLLVVEHARFIEKTNVSLALKEISRIISIYKESGNNFIPIELLNNYGVYLFKNNVYTEANTIFSECFSRLKMEHFKKSPYIDSLELTLTFNTARVKEELGYTDKAIALYKQLLKLKPNYFEANIRLGKIAEKCSNYKLASNYYQEVITRDPHNIEALSSLGYLYMKKKNFLEAQKKFESILKLPEHKNNAYAYLALGIIWLDQLCKPNRNKEKDKENVSRAFDMFNKVLKHHPKNAYAGNCIGVLLTFIGNYEEARECFAEVRENLFNDKGPWLNLAYVYGMLKNYLNAIQMYKATIEKFGLGNDPDILIALGCMYWKKEDYSNAMECMIQTVNIDPLNLYAKYNLAKIYTKIGLKIIESSNYSLSELDNSIDYFNESKNIFNDIYACLNNISDLKFKWKYLNVTQLIEESTICEDYLIQANSKRPEIVETEKAKEEGKKKQKEIILKLEEEKVAQMKLKESKEFERQNRLRDLRNEFLNMNKDALKVSVVEDKKKPSSKKESDKKKKTDDLDLFIVSDEEYERKNDKKKQRRKKKINRIRQIVSDEEESNDLKKQEDDTGKESFISNDDINTDNKICFSTLENETNENYKDEEFSSSSLSTSGVFGPNTDDSSNSLSN